MREWEEREELSPFPEYKLKASCNHIAGMQSVYTVKHSLSSGSTSLSQRCTQRSLCSRCSWKAMLSHSLLLLLLLLLLSLALVLFLSFPSLSLTLLLYLFLSFIITAFLFGPLFALPLHLYPSLFCPRREEVDFWLLSFCIARGNSQMHELNRNNH